MKKLIVLAALSSMAAAPAMASKARLSSLGNAAQLIDVQTMFVNPADLEYTGDWATLEFGNHDAATYTYAATGTTYAAPAHAEGGFAHTFSWGKLGVYLGHQDDSANLMTRTANAFAITTAGSVAGAGNLLLEEQNPLDLFYGTDFSGMKFGVGVHYANSKSDVGDAKVHTAGISAGLRTDVWDAAVRIGLDGKSEVTNGTTNETVKSDGYYKINGGYNIDTWYVYANYSNVTAKINLGTGDNKATNTGWQVGAINNHKVDGGNFFYGVSYLSTEQKLDSTPGVKVDESGLPVLVGMEIDATSWMTLRGSVSQTVLVEEHKSNATGTDIKTNLMNDTTVAAGVGFKLNKFVVDASIAAASSATGAIATNDDKFLTNASLTYNF